MNDCFWGPKVITIWAEVCIQAYSLHITVANFILKQSEPNLTICWCWPTFDQSYEAHFLYTVSEKRKSTSLMSGDDDVGFILSQIKGLETVVDDDVDVVVARRWKRDTCGRVILTVYQWTFLYAALSEWPLFGCGITIILFAYVAFHFVSVHQHLAVEARFATSWHQKSMKA